MSNSKESSPVLKNELANPTDTIATDSQDSSCENFKTVLRSSKSQEQINNAELLHIQQNENDIEPILDEKLTEEIHPKNTSIATELDSPLEIDKTPEVTSAPEAEVVAKTTEATSNSETELLTNTTEKTDDLKNQSVDKTAETATASKSEEPSSTNVETAIHEDDENNRTPSSTNFESTENNYEDLESAIDIVEGTDPSANSPDKSADVTSQSKHPVNAVTDDKSTANTELSVSSGCQSPSSPKMGMSVAEFIGEAGDDEEKFRKLKEMLEQDAISNSEVVYAVLSLMVGGVFDPEIHFIITKSENIQRMINLMDSCSPTLQGELWSHLTAILRRNTMNLLTTNKISLVEKILERLPLADDLMADLLIDLLGVLTCFSINVKELTLMFGLLKSNDQGKWRRNSCKLLKVLQTMTQKNGPEAYFNFPGTKGSAIALPPLSRWPYQNGWTFHCWLRLDLLSNTQAEREKPYLFCFRTAKGVGYSGHFLGNALVITSMKVKGKGFQHCVKFDFKPREWYMVTIAFVYNRWSKSELFCYVDGVLSSHTDMSWLVSTNDPYDKCYLGCSHEVDTDTMFCGQVASVYLFNEALSANHIAALEHLGPAYKGQFKFETETGIILSEPIKKVLYDGKLSQGIIFSYSPIACDSQLCLESSPRCNVSYFVHNPHALMLNGVEAVHTQSIHSALHSIGGVQVLYPLFGQLDLVQETNNEEEEEKVDYSVCATLISLLCELLETSPTIQQQLLQSKGFLVISFLLEKATRGHMTDSVLDSFIYLTKYFVSGIGSSGVLLRQLLDHILFNPALWIYASVPVQHRLLSYLSGEFVSDGQVYSHIRRVSSVLQTMHSLTFYYWVVDPKDRSGIVVKGTDESRPGRSEIIELRSLLLQYVCQLVTKATGIQDDELQSIINYLSIINEDDNLADVLELLVHLMADHPSSMVPAFDRKGGVKLIFKLLGSGSELIRIQALKLLGFFLMRSTHKRKHDALMPYNLFSLISERLLLHSPSITLSTYHTLFEVMTEQMTTNIEERERDLSEGQYKIENSQVLKVVASLIRQSPSDDLTNLVKKCFLSDLTNLCLNSKENRRIVLQMSVWQDWLFGLSPVYARNADEQTVTEQTMSLFSLLLHHAIKFEYGGWRVWIDTLAILHSKISYEDFRVHMARVYQQYEQMQASNESANHSADNESRSPASTYRVSKKENGSRVAANQKAENESGSGELTNGDASKGELSSRKNLTNEIDITDTDKSQLSPPSKQMFSPGPRAPPFRIPEFRWSYLHQKLLTDLLQSLEQDVQAWKNHATKTVIDYVNASENHVFVVNVTHMISQLADILVTSCGGLLPLLAAATSPTGEIEMLEPSQGLSTEQSVTLLQRLVGLTDILVFASSLNFSELEQEKSMNSGGILRQCLRLVCTCAVRNCLECRYWQDANTPHGARHEDARPDYLNHLIAGSHVSGDKHGLSGVRDIEKLLQDMDINRLRAVVYRDVEETKQAQFLALAIVYFVSVLMVSKYRDILEPSNLVCRRNSVIEKEDDNSKKKKVPTATLR